MGKGLSQAGVGKSGGTQKRPFPRTTTPGKPEMLPLESHWKSWTPLPWAGSSFCGLHQLPSQGGPFEVVRAP
jgi:hypothetical protein